MPLRASKSPVLNLRVLLVDDNAFGLSARRSVLEEFGCRTATAASAIEALDLFHRSTFDLVVTDYKMPRMDGIELIHRLRQERPGLPVVMISGFVDALGLNEANTGADVVIQKSANEVAHLLRAVGRLVRRKPARKPASSVAAGQKAKAFQQGA